MNLCTTTESSFQLNSSYQNINKMSKYKYINNCNLQKKVKLLIDNESKDNIILFQNTVINLPTIKINAEKKDSIKNSLNSNKIDQTFFNRINNPKLKSNKSLKGNNLFDSKTHFSSEISYPSNVLKKRICKSNSVMNITKENINNILGPVKNSKKKIVNKRSLIGRRLNVITRNIQNAKEAISNPNEFYVNLFNNIIKRESFLNLSQVQEEDKKSKKTNKFLSSRTLEVNEGGNQILVKSSRIGSKLFENIT